MPRVSLPDRFSRRWRGYTCYMINTIERKISDVNDSVTVRLDDLETTLPPIPSKALAASRASARRVNDIIESVASSIRNRFDNVADDTATAVKTTTGQAKSATERATKTVKTGVAQTTGQARAATTKAAKTVKSGVKQSTGQAKAQARKVSKSVAKEVEGALDDAKVATDPDRYADMTKSELYDRATDRDIEGRSGMTKAELIGALQKA